MNKVDILPRINCFEYDSNRENLFPVIEYMNLYSCQCLFFSGFYFCRKNHFYFLQISFRLVKCGKGIFL